MNTRALIFSGFLLVSLTAGCGRVGGSKSDEPDGFQQALAYAQCIRANGVPNFPDPLKEGGGVKVQGGEYLASPEGRKAAEACRDKDPQGDDDTDGGTVDAAKLAAWMKCMRAKLPKFPDAQTNGGTITILLQGTGLKSDSAEFENARRSCEPQFPGGNLKIVGAQ
ncbi:hypothetical protein ACIA5D_37920 [Actinoplanes sp. NPDC051513]|uniref:hypothetical protein n=1 Tax=Actinoplanes sp. NPDC051513 TaxID=3363908 RepID=UPI0037BA3234